MLELIFQGLFEWIYDMILEVWNYFCDSMMDIMSLDFQYLQQQMPIIGEIRQILLGVGWALLIGNLVFQATKSMAAGLGFEGEDPKLLFSRTFVFAFLLLASPQICDIALNMTSVVMEMMDVPDAVNVHLSDDSLFGSLQANWAVVIIVDIILMVKVLKMLIAVAERYVILSVLTITAPLAFGCGGSKNTSDIFSGWCRMYGSMCVLMFVNILFLKMLLSVASAVPSGLDAFAWMVLILAIAKVAKKADTIITRIGLNPAIADNSNSRVPGMLTYAVVRMASNSITKAAGKNAGGSGRARGGSSSGGPRTGPIPPSGGGGSTTVTPGSPGTGTPPSGGGSGGAPALTVADATYANENAVQTGGVTQVHSQQDGGKQNMTQQNGGAQGGGVKMGGAQTTQKQQSSDSTQFNGGVKQAGKASTGQTRKTSVPRGARRGASHVKLTPINQAGPGKTPTGKPTGTAGTGAPAPKAGSPTVTPGTESKTTPVNNSTRVSHVAGQKVQSGAVNSTVKAAEQSSVNTGKMTHTTSHPGSKEAVPGSGTGTSGKDAGKSATVFGAMPTRSTQRPEAPVTPTKTVPGTPGQPGMAGKAAPAAKQPPVSETRQGRNGAVPSTESTTIREQTTTPAPQEKRTPPATAAPSTKTAAPSPARQEARPTPAGVAQPTKQTASTRRPGTAGTAVQAQRAAQGQQPAMRQAARAPSTPTAKDSRNVKKTASTATATKKQEPSRKTSAKPPKPPTLKGGTGHGG